MPYVVRLAYRPPGFAAQANLGAINRVFYRPIWTEGVVREIPGYVEEYEYISQCAGNILISPGVDLVVKLP